MRDEDIGMMGYKTPNIDRIAREGALFTEGIQDQCKISISSVQHFEPDPAFKVLARRSKISKWCPSGDLRNLGTYNGKISSTARRK